MSVEYAALVQGQLQALRDEIRDLRCKVQEQAITIRGLCGQVVDLQQRVHDEAPVVAVGNGANR